MQSSQVTNVRQHLAFQGSLAHMCILEQEYGNS